MATWYRVGRWGLEIEAIEAISETESTLVVKNSFGKPEKARVRKAGTYTYLPSWHEAKQWLVERAQKEADSAAWSVTTSQKKLKNALALEEPCVAPK